jgi:hypothetical protein
MKTQSTCSHAGRSLVMAVSLILFTAVGSVRAASGPEAMDSQASVNEASVVDKISASFDTVAGSSDNAIALVVGLHDGSDISLSTTDPVTTTTTVTTFTPATGAMGYGNVYIALGLAEASLEEAGVVSPTATDIEAALNGGTVTPDINDPATTVELTGVLVLRADGMGWGKIANQIGVKLGRVMSALKHDANALKKANKPARPRTK